MLGTRGEMANDNERDERNPMLSGNGHLSYENRRLSKLVHDEEASSIIQSHVSVQEHKMADSSVGERLPYNDYTTIDWFHDLVRSTYQMGTLLY